MGASSLKTRERHADLAVSALFSLSGRRTTRHRREFGMKRSIYVAIAFGFSLGVVATTGAGAIEDVVIVRSVRESRVAATPFCDRSRTGFGNAANEDRFSLCAVVTNNNGIV